jgi:Leucine-rich repeat (LRR) protein
LEVWKVNLSGNHLQALPASFADLTKLTKVKLNNNKFKFSPPPVFELPELTFLEAFGNEFTALLWVISNTTTLVHLNLNNNLLRTLPPEIGTLSNLTELKLAHNDLSPPAERGGGLAVMHLQHNRLKTLPTAMGEMGRIEMLHLNDNQFGRSQPSSLFCHISPTYSWYRSRLTLNPVATRYDRQHHRHSGSFVNNISAENIQVETRQKRATLSKKQRLNNSVTGSN